MSSQAPRHALSQNERIARHLKTGKTLTQLQALRLFRCMRLASRINDLRKDYGFGDSIKTKTIWRKGKHWTEYSLEMPKKRGAK